MTQLLLAVAAAAVGIVVGAATHRLNQVLGAGEEDATGDPLPAEWAWAPVLDAILLGALFYRFGLGVFTLAGAMVVIVLVQVLVFDARHRLILNRVIYPSIVLAVLVSPINPLLNANGLREHLLSAVIGAVIAGGLFFIMVLVTGGGVGLGDAKLAFFMGAALGIFPFLDAPVLRALLYGIVLGGVVALVLLVTRVRKMSDYIPYGPYLCLGGVMALLFPCGVLGPSSC